MKRIIKNIQNHFCKLTFAGLLIAQPVYSAGNPINKLAVLAESDPQAAKILADEMMLDHAGMPTFDALLSKIAFKLKDYQTATYTLKRMMIREPRNQDYRFQLAFAYYQMNNLGAAKTEIDKLLAAENNNKQILALSNTLKERIELKQLNQARFDQHSLSLTHFHSTNANSGIDQSSVFLPLLNSNLTLTEGQKEADSATEIAYAWFQKKPLTQSSQLNTHVRFSSRHYQTLDQFNQQLLFANLGYKKQFSKIDLNIATHLQPLILDNKFYQINYGLNTNIESQTSQKTRLSLGLGVDRTDNDQSKERSTNNANLSTSLSYFGQGMSTFTLSHRQEAEVYAKGTSHANQQWIGALSYLARINNALSYRLEGRFSQKDYREINALFKKKRKDQIQQVNASLTYQLNKKWNLQTAFTWQQQDSNIDLYTWDKQQLGATVSYSF